MALLLAPYNEAMRIGMGFNSYTQQMCVNDVVRRSDNRQASDRDLRSIEHDQGLPSISLNSDSTILGSNRGAGIRTVVDGQSEVSQVVNWEAGFVENLSDVSNSLNISGALSITVAAIGGGGGASGYYNDTTSFLKSDAKYNILVKVTNQKLIADDVTKFTPIPNIPDSKFNEIYGDCFISGFIEGGVLNALILKRMATDVKTKAFGGELNIKMDMKAVNVEGSAKGDKLDEETTENIETKICVSWQGGGDVKPDSVGAWTIKTLMQVAMEFPDKVAACPQRTYAILTKYTALRSFHEQTVKGSPLDYEIAGLYTSALLDSYMEYKLMWSELLQTIKDLDREKSNVRKRLKDNKLSAYGDLVKADYESRMKRYNEVKSALTRSSRSSQDIILEEPLPANKVEPYDEDAFGLDNAAKDCRFEMIKIVREVNEVTHDPKTATDPNRQWRFLSPHVFRLLIPSDKAPMPTREQIDQMKDELQMAIDEAKVKQRQLYDTEQALQNSTADCIIKQAELDRAKKQNEITSKEAETLRAKLQIATDAAETKQWPDDANRALQESKAYFVEKQAELDRVKEYNDTLSKENEAQRTRLQEEFEQAKEENAALSRENEAQRTKLQGELEQAKDQNVTLSRENETLITQMRQDPNGNKQLITRAGDKIYLGGGIHWDLQWSMNKNLFTGQRFRMSYLAGEQTELKAGAKVFNDLERIDETWIPERYEFYFENSCLAGLSTTYSNGQTLKRGQCRELSITVDFTRDTVPDGRKNALTKMQFAVDPTEDEKTVFIREVRMQAASQKDYVYRAPDKPTREAVWMDSPAAEWSIRGFWGAYGNRIHSLGVIWGKG